MILYHASNCIVDNPDVLHSRNFLDFGKGFYMTSLEEQARKYALRFLLNEDKAEHYDIVSGGIADDKVFNTIDLYFSGNISKDEALRRLVFIHPNHQICILNQEVINRHLRFIKAEKIKL